MKHATVNDHWGDRWAVYDSRPTPHGFPILLGRPLGQGPLNRTGGNRVILTAPLVAYLESRRCRRGGIELPIGGTALKRLRGVLGHNIYEDVAGWWEAHADELADLTHAEFAARHGFTVTRVAQVHRAMFGRRNRSAGWWRQGEARDLLLSDRPRAEVAFRLGVSVGSVGRLRYQLRSG